MALGIVADVLVRFLGVVVFASGPFWLCDPVKCIPLQLHKCQSPARHTYCSSRSTLRSTPYEPRHSDIRPIPRRAKHGRRRNYPHLQLPRLESPHWCLPCFPCNWRGLVGHSGVSGERERAQEACLEYRDYIHRCHHAHRGMSWSLLNWSWMRFFSHWFRYRSCTCVWIATMLCMLEAE